jgi:hypothetical protein
LLLGSAKGRRGEMADARDLKSLIPRGVCGFDSRRRHFLMCFSCSRLNAPSRICLRFRAIFGQLLAILTFCARQREVREVPHQRKGWFIFRENIPGPEAFRRLLPARLLSGQKAASSELQLSRCREERAAAKAAQLARGDMDAVQLTGRDRLIYGRALDAITATGVALDAAATEYAQPAKTLAGHSLLDAANFYMRHHANGVAGRMVSEATEYFRQAKSGAGRSSVYLKEIRYRLGSFARAFNIEVRELVPQDVADYLEGLKLHPRNFNNQLAMLRTFFAFCEARGWLSKHADLLSRIERRSTTGSGIEIFTPAELRAFTR